MNELDLTDEPTELLRQAVQELHENRLLLPVIVAVGGAPRGISYLSHKLGAAKQDIYRRLRRLIELGLVIRTEDKKYVLVGISPLLVAKAARLITEPGEPIKQVVRVPEPRQALGYVLKADKLLEQPLDPIPPPVVVPKPATTMAEKVAQRFRVPAHRPEGDAVIGHVANCMLCQKLTPLKYGTVPICYSCANPERKR